MITISHTHEEGTLVSGTRRGDGSAEILKARGFRWFRSLGQWGVPHSRDREPKKTVIQMAADALRAAGFEVNITLDNTYRTAAEVESDGISHREYRAAALAAKADRHQDDADSAWRAHEHAVQSLPEFGQPLLIGHHSYPRHLRAIEKSWSSLGKAVGAEELAKETRHRADVAAAAQDLKYSVHQVAERLDRLRAEQRADVRARDGHTRTVDKSRGLTETTRAATGQARTDLIARIAAREDQITYWEAVRASQIEAGQATNYGPDTIHVGDLVKYRRFWFPVLRVNKVSVTVPSLVGEGFTHTVPYHRLNGHKPPDSPTTTAQS